MGVTLSKAVVIAVLSGCCALAKVAWSKRLQEVADYVGTLSRRCRETSTDAELGSRREFKRRLADQKEAQKPSTTCCPGLRRGPRGRRVLDQRPAFDVQVMGAAACTWATRCRR